MQIKNRNVSWNMKSNFCSMIQIFDFLKFQAKFEVKQFSFLKRKSCLNAFKNHAAHFLLKDNNEL